MDSGLVHLHIIFFFCWHSLDSPFLGYFFILSFASCLVHKGDNYMTTTADSAISINSRMLHGAGFDSLLHFVFLEHFINLACISK